MKLLEFYKNFTAIFPLSILKALLGQLDTLPVDILHAAEHESRIHRRNKMRLGRLAMNEQNLCQFLEKQLRNHFTPTFQPNKRRRRKHHRSGQASLKLVGLCSSMTTKSHKENK